MPPAWQVLFRSLHRLLMDTAAHEYLFCLELWGEEGPYRELFSPILSFVETSLAAALQVGGGRRAVHVTVWMRLRVRLCVWASCARARCVLGEGWPWRCLQRC